MLTRWKWYKYFITSLKIWGKAYNNTPSNELNTTPSKVKHTNLVTNNLNGPYFWKVLKASQKSQGNFLKKTPT